MKKRILCLCLIVSMLLPVSALAAAPAPMQSVAAGYVDIVPVSNDFLVFQNTLINQQGTRRTFSFTSRNGLSFRAWARNTGTAPLRVSIYESNNPNIIPNSPRATMVLQPGQQLDAGIVAYSWNEALSAGWITNVNERIYIVFESTAPLRGEFSFRQWGGQAIFP